MHRPVARIAFLSAALILTAACSRAIPDAPTPAPSDAAAAPAQTPAAPPAPAVAPPPIRTDFTLDRSAEQGATIRGSAPTSTVSLTFNGAPVALADDGSFVIAFDRDAGSTATLRASLADGRSVERPLAVAPGQWRIENIDANPSGGAGTTAEFQRRRPGELAQINAARRTAVTSDGWRQAFIWPVTGRRSGYFGSQRIYRGEPGSYHSGADVAAATGTVFVAPADGVVTLAVDSPFTLEGNLLIVDHGMGLSSAFLHASRLDVKTGDVVRQGQPLGAVGATGRTTGPHLHWGMKWHAARIDPAKLAGPMPVPAPKSTP